MGELLERFSEELEFSCQREFSCYIVKVSEKPRGKILGENLKKLLDKVKHISERIHNEFAEDSNSFGYNYFPYFQLVICYGNYQYHFLVVRKDYQYE